MKSLLYTTTKYFVFTFFFAAIFSSSVFGQDNKQQTTKTTIEVPATEQTTEEVKPLAPKTNIEIAGKRNKAINNIVPRIKSMMAAKGKKNKIEEFIPRCETKMA